MWSVLPFDNLNGYESVRIYKPDKYKKQSDFQVIVTDLKQNDYLLTISQLATWL
ncbi:hypothetical protein ABE096_00455 [Robertmurraya massiliosenegalensis]